MSGSYVIEQIGPETIDRAYALARTIAENLRLDEWRQFCRSLESSSAKREIGDEREEIVVARNAEGYVKGFSIFAIRDHTTYGRLLDVPVFVVASAADREGVAAELLNFLRAKCAKSVCSGIRFWTMSPRTWAERLRPEHIARSDHGLFMTALASDAEIEKAFYAHGARNLEAMDQFSR
jgi:hypothetical protein